MTEQAAKKSDHPPNEKAAGHIGNTCRVEWWPEFFTAVLGDDENILGMYVVGNHASGMIAAAAIMTEDGMMAEDVQTIVILRPTVAEIEREVMISLVY